MIYLYATSHSCCTKSVIRLQFIYCVKPCRVGLVVSMSGHTKDHPKNGTNCLPAWHAMR